MSLHHGASWTVGTIQLFKPAAPSVLQAAWKLSSSISAPEEAWHGIGDIGRGGMLFTLRVKVELSTHCIAWPTNGNNLEFVSTQSS